MNKEPLQPAGLNLSAREICLIQNLRRMTEKDQAFLLAFASASAYENDIPAPRLLLINGGRPA